MFLQQSTTDSPNTDSAEEFSVFCFVLFFYTDHAAKTMLLPAEAHYSQGTFINSDIKCGNDVTITKCLFMLDWISSETASVAHKLNAAQSRGWGRQKWDICKYSKIHHSTIISASVTCIFVTTVSGHLQFPDCQSEVASCWSLPGSPSTGLGWPRLHVEDHKHW